MQAWDDVQAAALAAGPGWIEEVHRLITEGSANKQRTLVLKALSMGAPDKSLRCPAFAVPYSRVIAELSSSDRVVAIEPPSKHSEADGLRVSALGNAFQHSETSAVRFPALGNGHPLPLIPPNPH